MTQTIRIAQAARPRRDDLIQLVLGGLWPAEAALEALLDRIEAGEAA
ncbi:hypothetical protein KO516_21090 [Citreicella sp. C3M06]|nr:hypothetical protein [Citreicella sp. C3M06]MBU2963275.1 hypothetical protein [Citreicella sp. C3M06]